MTLSIDERIERLWFRCFGMTYDEWKEEEHKRDKSGRFTKGSQSAMKSVKANITRGRNAMNIAIAEKRTVHRAMYHNSLGWVDFEWGDEGKLLPSGKTKGAMGIAHIIESRMRKDNMSYQQVVKMLTENVIDTVAKGTTSRIYESGKVKSVFIDYNGNRATLIKKEGSNGWLMNAFELKSTGEQVGSNDPILPTHSKPTRQRQGVGAVDGYIIIQHSRRVQQQQKVLTTPIIEQRLANLEARIYQRGTK